MKRRPFATPLDLTTADERLRERFWSKVEKRGPDECWPWLAYRNERGYGRFYPEPGRHVTASRAALALTIGRPLALGEVACHSCDNPPCCNAAHLFVGTQSDNQLDAITKGRWKAARIGTEHRSAKLTEDQVREIRSATYRYGSDAEFARRFGTNRDAIRKVRVGLSWTHVA